MHRFIKLSLFCISTAVFWCMAENFLVSEKPERRKTASQLRQEIVELMGDVLELESAYVETKGQIQQVLCKHIRSLAENDKKSSFAKAPLCDLQQSLKMLRQEKSRYEKELAHEKRFLAQLRANLAQ